MIHPEGTVDVEILVLGAEPRLLEHVDRSLGLTGPIAVRVLVMHHFMELYLDEYLFTVQSLHPRAAGNLTTQGLDSISCLTRSR